MKKYKQKIEFENRPKKWIFDHQTDVIKFSGKN
jgi:hypothetical protein